MRWPQFELWRFCLAICWFAGAAYAITQWHEGRFGFLLPISPFLICGGIGTLYGDVRAGIIIGVAISMLLIGILSGLYGLNSAPHHLPTRTSRGTNRL